MKKFIALLLCVLLTVSFAATAYANEAENADDVIALRFSNVSSVTTTFNISSTGKATVKNRYVGISGVTTGGKITTKVQKKVKSQGNGITAGWYVSTHNSEIRMRLVTAISIPYFGNMPDLTSENMPWNSLVYKVQMTPVQVWTGN